MRAHSAPPACGPWTSRPVAQSTRRRSSSGSSRSPDMRTTPSSESDRGARRRWHTNEREHVEPGGIEGLPARHDLRAARRTAPGLNSWSDGPTEAGHAGAGEDIGSDLRAVAPLTRSDTLGVKVITREEVVHGAEATASWSPSAGSVPMPLKYVLPPRLPNRFSAPTDASPTSVRRRSLHYVQQDAPQ